MSPRKIEISASLFVAEDIVLIWSFNSFLLIILFSNLVAT